MLNEKNYPSLELEYEDARLTVRIRPATEVTNSDIHWELGSFFSDVRGEDDVRVIVITGKYDGEFLTPEKTATYGESRLPDDLHGMWRVFAGITRCHEALTALEKPVIAQVNGDAIGFGQSVVFGCDIIVAAEEVRIADVHLALGEVEPYGPTYGMGPGDGGLVYVPLYMAPPLAKEYLMLSPVLHARELAERRLINYAVPRDQLETTVNDIVQRLLRRPSYLLAWTKRMANRHVVQQMNMTLDAAAAHEMIGFYQLAKNGWQDPTKL
jgi:enoyl-CoA hydratase/carnithine racemase